MQSVCSADQSVLACALCGQFPVNVVETQCSLQCSPLYCWECVVRLDRCVMCTTKIDIEKLRPLPFLRQRLSMLNVRCKNEGCGAVFKSGERDKHDRECAFALVGCSVSPMCVGVRRSDLAAHEASCPNRMVACPELCGERMIASALQEHVAACAAKLVPCGLGKCAHEARRAELDVHRRECPHREVECTLAAMGCQFKGPAQELNRHLKHDTLHWQLVATEYAKLKERLNAVAPPPSPSPPASQTATAIPEQPVRVEEVQAKVFFLLIAAFCAFLFVCTRTSAPFICIGVVLSVATLTYGPPCRTGFPKFLRFVSFLLLMWMAFYWIARSRSFLWLGLLAFISGFVTRTCVRLNSQIAHCCAAQNVRACGSRASLCPPASCALSLNTPQPAHTFAAQTSIAPHTGSGKKGV